GAGLGAAGRARPACQAHAGGGGDRSDLARRADQRGRVRAAAHGVRDAPLSCTPAARTRMSTAAVRRRLHLFRGALADSPPLWWSLLYFFSLLCGYYVLRPVRDAMGASGDVATVFPGWLVEWAAGQGLV